MARGSNDDRRVWKVACKLRGGSAKAERSALHVRGSELAPRVVGTLACESDENRLLPVTSTAPSCIVDIKLLPCHGRFRTRHDSPHTA